MDRPGDIITLWLMSIPPITGAVTGRPIMLCPGVDTDICGPPISGWNAGTAAGAVAGGTGMAGMVGTLPPPPPPACIVARSLSVTKNCCPPPDVFIQASLLRPLESVSVIRTYKMCMGLSALSLHCVRQRVHVSAPTSPPLPPRGG